MEIGADYDRIFAVKPERIINIGEVLGDELYAALLRVPRLAVGEIAGRDSVAAIIAAARDGLFDTLLPTMIYTGTEYGDWRIVFHTVDKLRAFLQETYGKQVYPMAVLGSPKLWHALNGRFMHVIYSRYGTYAPCPGCHLYMHVCRIPVARAINATVVIAGERESHDGRQKINQTKVALDAYLQVFRAFDLELHLPLRHVKSGTEVEALLPSAWREGDQQLACVFSGNYLEVDRSLNYQEEAWRKIFSEFLLPATIEIVTDLVRGREPNYEKVAASYLKEPSVSGTRTLPQRQTKEQ